MNDPITLAARNNARWCDAVYRSHGLRTTYGPRVWAVSGRSPDGYPDAVTLDRRVSAAQVLSKVDAGPGCSVKDSFATVDLAACGLEILFAAQWILRPASSDTFGQELCWRTVFRPADLSKWAAAHGMTDAFRAALLAERDVKILAAWDGTELVGGAVLNRSGPVVGVSNLFCRGADPRAVWQDVVRAAARLFPGLPLVGYESGDDLKHAMTTGFAPIGRLRVWVG